MIKLTTENLNEQEKQYAKRPKSEIQSKFIPPNDDEIDYKVVLNEKMERIGINHNTEATYVVTRCSSEFAKTHILPGSEIIKVNNIWLMNNMDCFSEKEVDDMFDKLKNEPPSTIYFRIKKIAFQRGYHFELNINFKTKTTETDSIKIPYHKYIKSVLTKIFSPKLNPNYKDLEELKAKESTKKIDTKKVTDRKNKPLLIRSTDLNIYGLFVIENGISMLCFIPFSCAQFILSYWLRNDIFLALNMPLYLMDIIGTFYDGMSSDKYLEKLFNSKDIMKDCIDELIKLYGDNNMDNIDIKIECIDYCKSERNKFWNCGFHENRDKYDNMNSYGNCAYLVKGKDNNRDAWYYLFVEPEKVKTFDGALNDDIIQLDTFGSILYSAYGQAPSQSIIDIVEHECCAHWYPWIMKYNTNQS